MDYPPDDERTVLATGASTPAPPPQAGAGRGNAFPVGARLGEFEITGLLGEGGFGIVYLAWDSSLERQVAVKEYMPASFASRTATMQVAVTSERDTDTFQAGLRSFVNEARILAQFDHPALIKVYRFWEANGTAYMVMPYYQGQTLKRTLQERAAPPGEAWLKAILAPLLDTLALIHAHQCYHRDIAPDNIMMLPSGRPLLLDFGAARQAIGDMQQAFTVIFKQNYAPIEQYAEMPGMRQGPWTDLYALASVIHFAITGAAPPPAVARLAQDPYVPLAMRHAGQYSAPFLQALDQALAVQPDQRPQSAAALRALLELDGEAAAAPAVLPTRQSGTPARPRRGVLLAAGGVAVLAAAGLAALYRPHQQAPPAPVAAAPAHAPPSTQAAAVPSVATPAPLPFDPVAALHAVAAGASLERSVTVSVARSTVRIGHDRLNFSVRASHAGYLYVQMVGSDSSNFYQLFPNAVDRDNRVKAGQTIQLPRAGWRMGVEGPAGIDHFVAIVADTPRRFDSAGLAPGALFSEFPIARAAELQRGYTGTTPLFAGVPDCAPGCSPLYGASRFAIEEVAQ